VQGDKKYIIVIQLLIYHKAVQIVWERSNENTRTGCKDTTITVCRTSNSNHGFVLHFRYIRPQISLNLKDGCFRIFHRFVLLLPPLRLEIV
jgi:hypothetical protein